MSPSSIGLNGLHYGCRLLRLFCFFGLARDFVSVCGDGCLLIALCRIKAFGGILALDIGPVAFL